MNNFFFCFALIGVLISCTENDNIQLSVGITGQWKWVESSGGQEGVTVTPETTDKEITIKFSGEKYQEYVNGILTEEKSYIIEMGKSIRKVEETELIIYEDNRIQSFELNENNLILYDECYDCFQHKYVKQ